MSKAALLELINAMYLDARRHITAPELIEKLDGYYLAAYCRISGE